MIDRNETDWTPNAVARRLSPFGSRHVTVALIGVLSLCLAACGAQPEVEAEAAGSAQPVAEVEATGGQEHTNEHTGHDAPADRIILEDLMELQSMKFGTVRQEGGKIGVDAEAKHNVVEATQNGQRYLRIAKREFAPDPGFNEFADDAIAAWATLETAAKASDVAALRAGIQSLGATCNACRRELLPVIIYLTYVKYYIPL